MPAHVFVTDRSNYNICMRRGVVGIPSADPNSRNANSINDALISRLSIVKEGDFIFFYVTSEKALYGIWQVDGDPFYDESVVWQDRLYPYRVRFVNTPYYYRTPLRLHDILDMQNEGKMWDFALKRASGSNAMFSLSDVEFRLLLNEYSKINPYTIQKQPILEPYPVKSGDLLERIHLDESGRIKYEAGVMAYLLSDLKQGKHKEFFGNYTDYLSYAPTTIGSEMDILLMFGSPLQPESISSYDILELKRDLFDEKALTQLIGYETWFLQKRAYGDQKMVRSTAIAQSFSPDVIQYIKMRERIEKKPVKMLRYSLSAQNELIFQPVE